MGVGLIRFLLASAVVMVHAGAFYNFRIFNGVMAVRTFFIISGFYMALILARKYDKYLSFLKSRFLRIYPLYWATIALIILVALLAHFVRGSWGELDYYATYGSQLSASMFLPFLFANMFILGRDIIGALGIDLQTGSFYFLSDTDTYTLSARGFLLMPQAWTIVLEILFYLIAPLLVKRKTWVLCLFIVMSIALREQMQRMGLWSFTWRYSFFPTELVFFMLGILSYRLYNILQTHVVIPRIISGGFSMGIIGTIFFYNYLPGRLTSPEYLFYIFFTLLLPFAFSFSHANRYDRIIGEWSYPIYISHLVVMSLIYPTLFDMTIRNRQWLSVTVLLSSILFSIIAIALIQHPIDTWRTKYAKPPQQANTPTD